MHKKAEAERAIRELAVKWMLETGFEPRPGYYPSFGSFVTWLQDKHFSHYLNFRSRVSARAEAEGWFESAIRNFWSARPAP